jgi:hypothetical protein
MILSLGVEWRHFGSSLVRWRELSMLEAQHPDQAPITASWGPLQYLARNIFASAVSSGLNQIHALIVQQAQVENFCSLFDVSWIRRYRVGRLCLFIMEIQQLIFAFIPAGKAGGFGEALPMILALLDTWKMQLPFWCIGGSLLLLAGWSHCLQFSWAGIRSE